MSIHFHKNDLPDNISFSDWVAVDTETMGLIPGRDPLCLVQISDGNGDAHVVQLDRSNYNAPNLKKIMTDSKSRKIFHYARFDLLVMKTYLGVNCGPVYCTRTASKLARTYTDKHGLRDVSKELLGVEINKQQQASDWGAPVLTKEQIAYAADDVMHLHKLREKLDEMLTRANRLELAYRCFDFISLRVDLDIAGWTGTDIFEH
jgi:ribonuclease D